MSARSSNPRPQPEHSSGATSEALAKVLAELRELAPGPEDTPEPAFPPRLIKSEKPPARAKKIEFEFETGRPAKRSPLKAAAAFVVLFAAGAIATNLAYPFLTGTSSTPRPTLAERGSSSPPEVAAPQQLASQGSAPSLRTTTLASASRDAPVPVGQEASDEGNINTTGAMPNVVAIAGDVRSEPSLEPSHPLAAPVPLARNEPGAANAPPEPASDSSSSRKNVATTRSAGGQDMQPSAPRPVVTVPAPDEPGTAVEATTSAPSPVDSARPGQEPSGGRQVAVIPEVKLVTPPSPDSAAAANADRLVRRAQDQIREGDISGARLVLERALASGSAQAAFTLAQTYDPQVLSEWRARGIKGDVARARQLYQRASEQGIIEAKERMASFR